MGSVVVFAVVFAAAAAAEVVSVTVFDQNIAEHDIEK
jgi:hypothetical protein